MGNSSQIKCYSVYLPPKTTPSPNEDFHLQDILFKSANKICVEFVQKTDKDQETEYFVIKQNQEREASEEDDLMMMMIFTNFFLLFMLLLVLAQGYVPYPGFFTSSSRILCLAL